MDDKKRMETQGTEKKPSLRERLHLGGRLRVGEKLHVGKRLKKTLIIAACVYFCLTFPTSKSIEHFEKKMSVGDRRNGETGRKKAKAKQAQLLSEQERSASTLGKGGNGQ